MLPSPPASIAGSHLSVNSTYGGLRPPPADASDRRPRRTSNGSVSFEPPLPLTRTASPQAIKSAEVSDPHPPPKGPIRVYSLGDNRGPRTTVLTDEKLNHLNSKILVYEDGNVRAVKWREEGGADFCTSRTNSNFAELMINML
jgi:hypothetical protein